MLAEARQLVLAGETAAASAFRAIADDVIDIFRSDGTSAAAPLWQLHLIGSASAAVCTIVRQFGGHFSYGWQREGVVVATELPLSALPTSTRAC